MQITNLIKNNYPNNVIVTEFDKFLKSKEPYNIKNPIPKDPESTTVFLSLPYINEKAEKITKNMTKLVKESFHKTELVVAFKAPAEISNLSLLKTE